MKLKAVPRSRAKTAWGLLQDVKRAILAEPKRANMGCYIGVHDPSEGGPACGTVGCFAGWITLLRGTPSRMNADFVAENILGSDIDYYTAGGNYYVFNVGHGDACATTTWGTRAHARAVAARITRFMKVNETALKTRKLSDVRA